MQYLLINWVFIAYFVAFDNFSPKKTKSEKKKQTAKYAVKTQFIRIIVGGHLL